MKILATCLISYTPADFVHSRKKKGFDFPYLKTGHYSKEVSLERALKQTTLSFPNTDEKS